MSFFGIDSEVTNPLTSDLIGNDYSITGLNTIGATDADITNLSVINQTIVNETVQNFDVTNVNTSNIFTTEITVGDSGVWDSDSNANLIYNNPDTDATLAAQSFLSPTLTTALAGNFQYTLANSDTYIADAVMSGWGTAGNTWGGGSAVITQYDYTSALYTITSPVPGLIENFAQSVYMGPDGTVVFVGTGTGGNTVNPDGSGVYVFDYLPASPPVYTQKIGTGLLDPVCCVLNDNPTRPTVAIVSGQNGALQIWKWNGSLYALDQSLTLPSAGSGLYFAPMNGYATKKMNDGSFLVSNLNTYAPQNATNYRVFKYDVSGSSYVLGETITIPRLATDINYGSLESNGKDIIIVSFTNTAANRTLVYKNTTTSPYALNQTLNRAGYAVFPKQGYGNILLIAEKVDAGLALGQYNIHLYVGAGGTYTFKSTVVAPTNTLSASIGAGGIVTTSIGDGLDWIYMGYGREPVGGGGTSSGTNSVVSRYSVAYFGASVIINGPLQADLKISQTVLNVGPGVYQLAEAQLRQGYMVNVTAGAFPTVYLPVGSRNGSWVMFYQTSALTAQIIDQYNNVIGSTSQNQWKRVIYNAITNTWSMDGSNFSNPLNQNIQGGNVYGIVGANSVEGLTVKTDTITLTPGSLLTSVQVNENLRMGATKAVEFSGDISLKHVGAGTAVTVESLPINVKPFVVGYDPGTYELTYFTTPSGGGGMITSVGGGNNITTDNVTNPAIPTVSLSSPLTANLNVGTVDITTSVANADIDMTTNGTGAVHITKDTAGTALRVANTVQGTATVITNTPAYVELYKNRGGTIAPVAGDTISQISAFGRDSAFNKQEYTRITSVIRDPTAGATRDGSMEFGVVTNNSFVNYIQLNGNDVPSGEVNILKPLDLATGSSGTIKTSVTNGNIVITANGMGYAELASGASGNANVSGSNAANILGVNGVNLRTGASVDKLKILPTAVELAGVPLDTKSQAIKSTTGSLIVGGGTAYDTRIDGTDIYMIAGSSSIANRFMACSGVSGNITFTRPISMYANNGVGNGPILTVVSSPFDSLQISGVPLAPSSGISDGSTTGSAGQVVTAIGGGNWQWQSPPSVPTWFSSAPAAPSGSLNMNDNHLSNVANFSWGAASGTTEYLGSSAAAPTTSIAGSIPITIGATTYYIPYYS
jgi:hypothetical protein